MPVRSSERREGGAHRTGSSSSSSPPIVLERASPQSEVMAAGPARTLSNLPGSPAGTTTTTTTMPPSTTNSPTAKGYGETAGSRGGMLDHKTEAQQAEDRRGRRQDSFDINGWPEGIDRPRRFLGMRIKPVSQWTVKHIFCLSY